MLTLVDKMLHLKSQIASPEELVKANELVVDLFQNVKGIQSGQIKLEKQVLRAISTPVFI